MSRALEEQQGITSVRTTYQPPVSQFIYEAESCTEDQDLSLIYYALIKAGYRGHLIEIREVSRPKVISSPKEEQVQRKHRLFFWRRWFRPQRN